jgi:glycosyltransferase involved in cell wall biosynthesis
LLVSDLENLCEDVIADGVGWSFRMGDPGSLAEQLTAIARQPERSLELRQRARQTYLERYTPEVDLVRLEKIYHEISGAQ